MGQHKPQIIVLTRPVVARLSVAAAMFDVSVRELKRIIAQGKIPTIKRPNSITRIRISDLERYFNKYLTGSKTEGEIVHAKKDSRVLPGGSAPLETDGRAKKRAPDHEWNLPIMFMEIESKRRSDAST